MRTYPSVRSRQLYGFFIIIGSVIVRKAAVVADEMQALLCARTISLIAKVHASMTVVFHEFAYVLPSIAVRSPRCSIWYELSAFPTVAMLLTLSFGIRAALSDGDLKTADIWIRADGEGFKCRRTGEQILVFHVYRARCSPSGRPRESRGPAAGNATFIPHGPSPWDAWKRC